jgi:signal transduction histidine kinase
LIIKPFFNYRIFIWVLLSLAIAMGGVFLVIAYTYDLQKETEKYIESTRISVNDAKDMEIELTAIKGLNYIYLINKSEFWLDSLRHQQARFVVYLERARKSSNTPEEDVLIQRISALFSNYEQNILLAVSLLKDSDISKVNALLNHSAQELLGTIQLKCNEFIDINKSAETLHELELARTNSLILLILISMGIGGIVAGILLGWLLSRMLFSPINQLVLKVRGSSGGAVFEHIKLPHGTELDELGESIKELIEKFNRTNEDLSRNKELLQYSNKFANLGKIAPTIAHEIRNPLAAIKMLVYSIREEPETPASVREDLDIISKEIDRIDNFTKDFLRFAKPTDPVFADVNPTECLGEVIQLFKPRLLKSSIKISNNTAKCKWHVMADASHLKQVFMNLILNAVEVMPDGGELTIDADVVSGADRNNPEEKRDFIKIAFCDSGPGIPEAIMKTLFEPFIKGSDKGVGIGLSISQSIADSHGGWIDAGNKTEGSGAVFTFYLPLIK